MADGRRDAQEPAIVVQKTYDLALWLLPKVEKFPRSFRFTVGDRAVQTAMDLLLALVEAAYTSDNRSLRACPPHFRALVRTCRL